jgi:non-structural maintenance of chromosomes element 1
MHCFATFRRSKASIVCPSCGKAWPKDTPLILVGEDAVREGNDRKRRFGVKGADNSEAEEDDTTQGTFPYSPPKKGRRPHRRKNEHQDGSMEVDNENSEQEEAQLTSKGRAEVRGDKQK